MSAQGQLLMQAVGAVVILCLLYVFATAGGALWSLRVRKRARSARVFALALLVASSASAGNFALVVNGDTDDRCHSHAENVAIATDALLRHGFTVYRAETRSEVATVLRRAVRNGVVNADSVVVIYTTGHGTKGGRLITDSGISWTLSPSWLARQVGAMPYSRLFYIGDQCYSDSMARALASLPRSRSVGANVGLGHCEKFAHTKWSAFNRDGDLDRLVSR